MAFRDGHGEGNVLIDALPPATSYVDYLTLLEFNLDKEKLPLLHHLLQDSHLTTNIGWDLVHLLVPLLPESEQCLLDVAKLGNPRETVLKVAELLEEIAQPPPLSDSNSLNGGIAEGDAASLTSHGSRTSPSDRASNDESVSDFDILLKMLCLLHPRIKTQYPSRFLLTSVSAIVRAFEAVAQAPTAFMAVLIFVKSVSQSRRRPPLPLRAGEIAIDAIDSAHPFPDPEASLEAASASEADKYLDLLRSLLSHAFFLHVDSLGLAGRSSAFAWTDRFIEKQEPRKVSVLQQSFCDLFTENCELRERDMLAQQSMSVAEIELSMPWENLASHLSSGAECDDPFDSGVSLQDYMPSNRGLLYLMAMKTNAILLSASEAPFQVPVFPNHQLLLTSFAQEGTFSDLSPSALDAMLLLGWAALIWNRGYSEAVDNEMFFEYLNQLNMISACTAQPCLRYNFNVYSSTILHSHSSSQTRLEYIKDTLENCPLWNLKAAAVSWLKSEIMSAFNLRPAVGPEIDGFKSNLELEGHDSNVFGSPDALSSIAPAMFTLSSPSDEPDITAKLPLWIASLNLLYFLHASPTVYAAMDVARSVGVHDVLTKFVPELSLIVRNLKESSEVEQHLHDGVSSSEIHALEDVLERIDTAFVTNT